MRHTINHKKFILIWIFAALCISVFGNVLAIQNNPPINKYNDEQVDVNRSAHIVPSISYQVALSILHKKHAPEQFAFMSLSKEVVVNQILHIRYLLQKKCSLDVLNASQHQFLKVLLYGAQASSEYHS